MNLAVLLIVLALVFLIAVLVSAQRAAKAGEKHMGKDDAIERWESKMEDNQAGRWWTRWWG